MTLDENMKILDQLRGCLSTAAVALIIPLKFYFKFWLSVDIYFNVELFHRYPIILHSVFVNVFIVILFICLFIC